MENTEYTQKILEYSIENNLGHIPSALSMHRYLFELFESNDSEAIITPSWNIVIGKPFGSQAYYVLWQHYLNLGISHVSYGLKHEEVSFVDYSEETLGNALGVASGISYNGKRTWCNISDGALQMGPTLESIQYIGHYKQNIVLTIDYNRTQLTGNTTDILGMTINGVYDLFYNAGWTTYIINTKDFNKKYIKKVLDKFNGPIVFLIETIKGDGVIEMMKDPVKYHYKKLNSLDEVTLCEKH